MSKFLYPIYKLNIESYKKWWLYHKKAGGSGILSEILQGFSFNLENTLNKKFKLFEIEGNSVQDGTPSPDNEVPIKSAGDNGSINEKIKNADGTKEQDYSIFVQQPMRSIGDVRDLFFKNTVDSPYYDENLTLNGWYERHAIEEIILNGTETITIHNSSGTRTVFRVQTNASNFNVIKQTGESCRCSHFIPVWQGASWVYGNISTRAGEYKNLYITMQANMTVEEFQSWLSINNVIVNMILAEPLDLPCTPEQVEQLENKPSTYKDFTYVTSQDETPAYLKIQYYKEG